MATYNESVHVNFAIQGTAVTTLSNFSDTLSVVIPVSVVGTDVVRIATDDLSVVVPVTVTVDDEYGHMEALSVIIPVSVTITESDIDDALDIEIPVDVLVYDFKYLPIYIGWEDGKRYLYWDGTGEDDDTYFWLLMDGKVVQVTQSFTYHPASGTVIRQYLTVMTKPETLTIAQTEAHVATPEDMVECSWAAIEDVRVYHLDRKLGAGAYGEIVATSALSFEDGPLTDGSYTYRVSGADREGDEDDSNEVVVVISSAPEPPSDIAWTFDTDTQTLTITWTASTSADIATYRVRSNGGSGLLGYSSTPVQDSAALTYEQVFTNEDGLYIFSVRAVDSDGNEEGNISQVVFVPLDNGLESWHPVGPRLVEATAIADGKVQVEFLYDPALEINGPGAAFEARIYWDAGTGTVDFTSSTAPLATVAMDGPEVPTRYTWDSDVLSNDQEYLFVVRIATEADPDGRESPGILTTAATTNNDVPDPPVLDAVSV